MSYWPLWRRVLMLGCSLLWLAAPILVFAEGLQAGAPGTGGQDVTPHWSYL